MWSPARLVVSAIASLKTRSAALFTTASSRGINLM